MLPHMVGEFVVLLFLKLPVVERFRLFRQFTGNRFSGEADAPSTGTVLPM